MMVNRFEILSEEEEEEMQSQISTRTRRNIKATEKMIEYRNEERSRRGRRKGNKGQDDEEVHVHEETKGNEGDRSRSEVELAMASMDRSHPLRHTSEGDNQVRLFVEQQQEQMI